MMVGYGGGLLSTWWRHQMETFSALLALGVGNSPVPVNSPHKGQWRGALMFSLICTRINDWVNNREFETPSWSLWRHHNVMTFCLIAPNHNPTQCWVIINKAPSNTHLDVFSLAILLPAIIKYAENILFQEWFSVIPRLPRAHELKGLGKRDHSRPGLMRIVKYIKHISHYTKGSEDA